MTSPDQQETRERIVRLEVVQEEIKGDVKELRADAKVLQGDVLSIAVGQKGLEVAFADHFADLRKSNGKRSHIEAIIAAGGMAVLGIIAGVLKLLGVV